MKGLIYKYTSPGGKIYVGQTTDPEKRRECFLDINTVYAGQKMEKERHKYSDLNKWKYEILYTLEGDEYVIREKLDFLEVYYIIKYDSIFSGLNTVLGNYTKIAYNRFFTEYYIKSDKKERHKILHNIQEEPSDPRNSKKPKMVLDMFWMDEVFKRDAPIKKGLFKMELNNIIKQIKSTKSKSILQKLNKKKQRLEKEIEKFDYNNESERVYSIQCYENKISSFKQVPYDHL